MKEANDGKAFISGLLEHYPPQDAQDLQDMLKDLLGDTLQEMLEAEMVQKLGYRLLIKERYRCVCNSVEFGLCLSVP